MTTNKLLQHFKRMQSKASEYIAPGEYTDLDGQTWNYDKRAGKSSAFIHDLIYMLDGPEWRAALREIEQREAEASVGNTYIDDALRTESGNFPLDESKYPEGSTDRLLHAAMGLTTEAGEFLDALKKHLFYGKPLDLVNLREEIGDIMWYLAIACSALGTDFETEQARNIAKLRKRYPEKFDAVQAVERDLAAERAILSDDERFANERKAEKQFGPSC